MTEKPGRYMTAPPRFSYSFSRVERDDRFVHIVNVEL